MISKLFLLPLLLPLSALAFEPQANASYSFTNEQGTTIVASGDGYNFTQTNFNDSAKSNQLLALDGLSFEYKLTNQQKNQTVGFYFNADGSHDLSKNTCTFTFAPSMVGDQTRFGIYKTHDIDKSFSRQVLPINQTGVVGQLGFGIDNTMVMNAAKTIDVVFSFKKIGPFYRVEIREVTKDLFWAANANYTSGPQGNYVYTYIEESHINKTTDGKAYLHVYGFKESGAANPISYVGSIQEAESSYTTVTYHYNKFEGGVPVVKTENVEINSLIEKPADPTYGNYYFAGWYSDSLFNTKWDFETDKVIDKTDLYAKWVTDPKDIDPEEKKETTGKVIGHVVQLSQSTFIIICVLGGLAAIGVIVLIWWLIRKLLLARRGGKILK